MTDEIKQILKSHGEQLDLIATKVVEHDERLDRITRVVVEHTERLGRIEENMATRADISNISNTLDKIVNLAEKKDQEMTLLSHDVRQIDDRLESVEKDVRKMKPALGIS